MAEDTFQDCACRRAWLLDPAHHDWILSFERRGLPGAVELIQYLEQTDEFVSEPNTLMWMDFPTFVAMHNWRHPADVHDLALHIVGGVEDRRRLHGTHPLAPKDEDEVPAWEQQMELVQRDNDQLRRVLTAVGGLLADPELCRA